MLFIPSSLLVSAYDTKTTLPIVRNALGLKVDINEFEIVTKDSLQKKERIIEGQPMLLNKEKGITIKLAWHALMISVSPQLNSRPTTRYSCCHYLGF